MFNEPRVESHVDIYDATLTQRQYDLSPEDKLRIAEKLHLFGIHYIEAGWPVVLPRDRVFFLRARSELNPELLKSLVAMAELPDRNSGPGSVVSTLLETGAGSFGLAIDAFDSEGQWLSAERIEELRTCIADLRAGVQQRGAAGAAVFVHLHNALDAYREDPARALAIMTAVAGAGGNAV
eukprot:CAMPEP_0172151366 /NCGR_PEP_ID=MMETSP1050-20130122/188_1 /TAXON_ID=233186 /ORGANISM="Cryptomonas curvata, Strain CCAP979/52" /LENGTH=179 /DNA_ID=CAMNT_0012819461 /DNA_START=169 /DNA_END=704 /DNA_ORIENTATION=+